MTGSNMRAVQVAAAVILAGRPVGSHAQQADATQWSIIRIAGAPVGWSRVTRRETATGPRVDQAMFIALNRLGKQVVIETSVSTAESSSGRLREVDATTKMSEQRTSTSVRIDAARIVVTSRAGDRSFERTLPGNADLLGTEGVRRATQGALRAVGDSISYREWDAQSNVIAMVTRRVLAVEQVSRGTGTILARKVIDRTSTSSMPVTSWLDSSGTPFRTQYMLPFGLTESIETDSAGAMLAAKGGELPEEQYARTLVYTKIKLPRARDIEQMRLTLRVTDSSIAIPDLAGPGQQLERRSAGLGILDVTRRRPRHVRARFPVAVTAATREYLEPNAYIQSDNVELQQLARQVVGNRRDVMAAALALQQWVSDHMTFDLGVAFAPSVEVFQRRRGTCVAYATLLATLARAVGIPSRIAMGYAYVNGMFGGHAWPEVLVGDEWIAIDAAIVADGPADAARFAFAWSSLADGPGSLSAGPGAALYGRLEATVESYTMDGVTRSVGMQATPYVVTGDRYVNPWLGIALVKPASFRFTDLDKTWPAMTVLSLEGAANERVRVESRLRTPWVRPDTQALAELEKVMPGVVTRETTVAGRRAWMRQGGGNRAVVAIPRGPETLVIDVSSPDAAGVLAQLLASLRLGSEGRRANHREHAGRGRNLRITRPTLR